MSACDMAGTVGHCERCKQPFDEFKVYRTTAAGQVVCSACSQVEKKTQQKKQKQAS